MEQKDKTNNINQKVTYEEILEDIKKMITEKKVYTIDEVKDYLKLTKLKDSEKEKILEEAESYIASDLKEIDIIQIRNQIISIIRAPRSKDEHFKISFNVSHNNMGPTLCKINISRIKQNHLREYKFNSFYYNEEFKKQMIEAIIDEVVLNNRLNDYYFEQSDSSIETLYNYYLNTINNIHINIIDIEKEYAYYLRSKINELVKMKRFNTEDREKEMENDDIIKPKEDESLSRVRVKDNY